ncbi:methanol oxidation system protein MoxJ [Chenggangzhangella methanolivorans]|uniref:Methanol oxidation system protein MoxJ n=1 Tax=Chenggangzhangella methanolivorans TaxID=1437009 RepID=A0A9E6ULJ7_9HYPH|nr:methanol oxidation system protein MoxJ [Chenggangzhangella methanolivorans]QZN99040.1 methanol oxidation system protein MoxJ [Chenggangzhangella methanolivorans]
MIRISTARRALTGAALLAAPFAASQSASAAEPLKVCASKIEAPYSTEKGDGLENRIANVVAKAMGREIEFVWFDRAAIYLVRDGLDKNLCDVVFGVDSDDERVLATKPIYRTGYVYVTKSEGGPELGSNWKGLEKTDATRFAVRFSTPAELILKEAGKYEDNVSYGLSLVNFQDKRNKYTQVEAGKLVSEVVNGDADAAIAFAPDVARYVKGASTPLKMTMIEDDFARSDGLKIPLHFDQSIGVRKDDEKLRAELDAAIAKAKPEIDRALSDEGVPVLPPNA